MGKNEDFSISAQETNGTRTMTSSRERRRLRVEVRELLQVGANHRWISEHYDELLKQKPDKWIVVHKGRVIARSKSHENLLHTIDKKGGAMRRVVARQRMEVNPLIYI